MKHPKWQAGYVVVLIALFSFACSGGNVDPTDGDLTPPTCESDAASCNSTLDCLDSCMICNLDGPEGCCAVLPCEDNMGCSDLGAGAYCQGNVCKCPSPDGDSGDGDQVDGDVQQPEGELCISPANIEFGSVQLGEAICKTVTLENCGESSLEINGLMLFQDRVSAEDMEISFKSSDNTPADDNIIELDIKLYKDDTKTLEFCYLPTNPGTDSGEIIFGTTIALNRMNWYSTEKGSPHIEVECERLTDSEEAIADLYGANWDKVCSFHNVPLGNEKTQPITIKNFQQDASETAVLVINRIEEQNPMDLESNRSQTYGIDPDTIDYQGFYNDVWISKEGEDSSSSFNLIYTPLRSSIQSSMRGLDLHEISLYHNDSTTNEGNAEKPFVIGIVGIGVMPVLTTDPVDTIDFNSVQKGQCATRVQLMTNTGQDTLNIISANLVSSPAVTSGVFTMELNPVLDPSVYTEIDENTIDNVPASLEAFEQTAISVTCCPQGNEAYSGRLEIVSNHEARSNPSDLRNINITCTGQQAFCDVSPKKELIFPCQRVGQSETQIVRINNNGLAPATIDDIHLAVSGDPDFEIGISHDWLPITVSSGATFEIDVHYKPTMKGNHSSELIITPREGDCEATTIQLYGCAIEPNMQAPEDCLEWENTQVVDPSITGDARLALLEKQQITLLNNGTATLNISEVFVPDIYADFFTITNIPGMPSQIPQGIEWGFNIAYDPTSYGDYNGNVVICSDAANANGAPNSCSDPLNPCCSDPTMTPHEICLNGTATNPQMCVFTPNGGTNGTITFTEVIVGDPPPPVQTVVIQNCGQLVNGYIKIEDIDYAWGGSEAIQMKKIEYNGVDYLDNYPAEGIELAPGEQILVDVGCYPEMQVPHKRLIHVTHNDIDMTKPGATIGNEAPIYRVEVYCYSTVNTLPKAIVKSPAGNPVGNFGTWDRTIMIGEEITFDGQDSYDNDTGDTVTNYDWNWDEGVTVLTTPTEGPGATSIRAQFLESGDFTVSLQVEDSHNGWSYPTDRDANLEVHVREKPIARAGRCVDLATYFETETEIPICFTAEHSFDNDGTIEAYDWEVEKIGGEKFNFSTSVTAQYTFDDPGVYLVSLKVTDNHGYESEVPDIVTVEVFADQNLRIELTWTGQGNVDLHYIKPSGTFDDPSSDCNGGTCTGSMDWQQYGNPVFSNPSDDGILAEIIAHDNPGDGEYKIGAEYVSALNECQVIPDCVFHEDDCDLCGCNCSAICWALRICCDDCTICTDKEVCADVPANLSFKMYVNDSPVAKYTHNVKLDETEDRTQFPINRVDGKWKQP